MQRVGPLFIFSVLSVASVVKSLVHSLVPANLFPLNLRNFAKNPRIPGV